jgi:hypothetical protein
VILDEAGMTDDQHLLRLDETTTTDRSSSRRRRPTASAVGPGGSLARLVQRFGGEWELTDNIRQADISEREALAEFDTATSRSPSSGCNRDGRIVTGSDQAEVIGVSSMDGSPTSIEGWTP